VWIRATHVTGADDARVLTHKMLSERVCGPEHMDDFEYLRVAIRAF
jgi:hypothetical protein